MKKTKKILSAVLAVVMLLSAAPIAEFGGVDGSFALTANAEDTEYTEGVLTYKVENGEAIITDCDYGVSGELVIPNTLGGYPVIGFSNEGVFAGSASLTSVTIPDSVTRIANDTFVECSALTSVTIPDSVTSIGDDAFHSCTRLTYITIPDSVTSIGRCAFAECYALTSITIPDSVTSIGDGALVDTAWFDAQPDGDIYAGKVYYKYKGTMPENTNIIIKSGTKSITDYAFFGCSGLTCVTIPDSVTSIGEYAFGNCSSLTSVTIPDSVTSIGTKAFGYYYSVEKIDNFTIYGYTETAAEAYAVENGFTFIALDATHTHTLTDWTVTTPATCTSDGEKKRSCTACDYVETQKISKGHDLEHIFVASTCKVAGVEYDVCYNCDNTFNYTVLPMASHTFSDWTVTKEATVFESGERERKCSVCGFVEKEIIEKLLSSEVKDNATGISVVYPNGSYDGDVKISVTETFDGTSYQVLNNEKGNFKNRLFDIVTTVGGEKVQPNGSVWVKIPLPDGYSPERTNVYYVTNDGKLEKMESRIENGYVIFETTHFSYYAVVDETDPEPQPEPTNPSANCSCNCHKSGIKKLFFKIGLIFQRIFKKNKTCKCGVRHY